MQSFVSEWLVKTGLSPSLARQVSYAVLAVCVLILCVSVLYVTKKVVIKFVTKHIHFNRIKWDDALLKSGVFHRLSHLIPIAILLAFSTSFGPYSVFVRKGIDIYLTFVSIMVIDAVLNAVDAIYRKREISKTRPIKGFLQVLKIIAYVVGGIVIIADLMGESPLVMISGIGALAAVFSFIFKDSLLGLVAGIQLSANDMIRIGDWIEMPKYSADGNVVDISLNTVKVQNFDNSITSIPAYALISDSFKNWRGMQSSGARRIMRAVNIDVNSISFCSQALLEQLEKSDYLKDYIETRQREIAEYNSRKELDPDGAGNARHLTNIGVFRIYIQNYLKTHPGIHKEMSQMVRQLPPGQFGLPLEIYAFANQTNWTAFENIQADIFDHILSIIGQFELRVFQNPSGYDLSARRNP